MIHYDASLLMDYEIKFCSKCSDVTCCLISLINEYGYHMLSLLLLPIMQLKQQCVRILSFSVRLLSSLFVNIISTVSVIWRAVKTWLSG